jgi:hypothetical protein
MQVSPGPLESRILKERYERGLRQNLGMENPDREDLTLHL